MSVKGRGGTQRVNGRKSITGGFATHAAAQRNPAPQALISAPAAVARVAGRAPRLLHCLLVRPPRLQACRACNQRGPRLRPLLLHERLRAAEEAEGQGEQQREGRGRTRQALQRLQQPAGAALPGVARHAPPARVQGHGQAAQGRCQLADRPLACAAAASAKSLGAAAGGRPPCCAPVQSPAGAEALQAGGPLPPASLPPPPEAVEVELNSADGALVVSIVAGGGPHHLGVPAPPQAAPREGVQHGTCGCAQPPPPCPAAASPATGAQPSTQRRAKPNQPAQAEHARTATAEKASPAMVWKGAVGTHPGSV